MRWKKKWAKVQELTLVAPGQRYQRRSVQEQLREMGMGSLEEYLCSAAWENTKQRYRQSEQYQKCFACRGEHWELYHKVYRRLGHEWLQDLVPLCRGCHADVLRLMKERGGNFEATVQTVRLDRQRDLR